MTSESQTLSPWASAGKLNSEEYCQAESPEAETVRNDNVQTKGENAVQCKAHGDI